MEDGSDFNMTCGVCYRALENPIEGFGNICMAVWRNVKKSMFASRTKWPCLEPAVFAGFYNCGQQFSAALLVLHYRKLSQQQHVA
jgi:hypothetical protein